MLNKVKRDDEYIHQLSGFIKNEYGITAQSITPAKRGYYGETWRMDSSEKSYFIKLDYFLRHQEKYKNSLPVIDYLCSSGIDFISKIIKTKQGEFYANFNSAILAIFEWLDGENLETDDTKSAEYQMLAKIYPLSKQGFNIPVLAFSSKTAGCFFEKWNALKSEATSEPHDTLHALLEQHSKMLFHCKERLSHFAALCQKDSSHFYLTHGDAGGNFFTGNKRNYIVDWDEVMYAPLERDAWVMCCREWAQKLFNETLKANGIQYELRPERLAFFCYHMFFLYLNEFFDDFLVHGTRKDIEEYFEGFILERIIYADTI